jgi:hypothetical protein
MRKKLKESGLPIPLEFIRKQPEPLSDEEWNRRFKKYELPEYYSSDRMISPGSNYTALHRIAKKNKPDSRISERHFAEKN